MSQLLPHDLDYAHYWQTIYRQPPAYWQPALEFIREQHGLPAGTWERFPLGRNIVFACGEIVVKLSPPFWHYEIPREADALRTIHAHLPVATPELIATGELGGWRYMVQSRLPGELLRSIRPSLTPDEQIAIARQHGELMAALHALPVQGAPASLAFDWAGMLAAQWAECLPFMRESGVAESLLEGVMPYLEQARPLIEADQRPAILHGDLDAINLLVERDHGHWRISGLVDWGDVKIGPVAHEFISPCIHSYRGARETLLAWYAGYGLTADQRTAQLEGYLMARLMLYYADEFGRHLNEVPGANECQSWAEIASCFWHLTVKEGV